MLLLFSSQAAVAAPYVLTPVKPDTYVEPNWPDGEHMVLPLGIARQQQYGARCSMEPEPGWRAGDDQPIRYFNG